MGNHPFNRRLYDRADRQALAAAQANSGPFIIPGHPDGQEDYKVDSPLIAGPTGAPVAAVELECKLRWTADANAPRYGFRYDTVHFLTRKAHLATTTIDYDGQTITVPTIWIIFDSTMTAAITCWISDAVKAPVVQVHCMGHEGENDIEDDFHDVPLTMCTICSAKHLAVAIAALLGARYQQYGPSMMPPESHGIVIPVPVIA